jgi:hypothetical protein
MLDIKIGYTLGGHGWQRWQIFEVDMAGENKKSPSGQTPRKS